MIILLVFYLLSIVSSIQFVDLINDFDHYLSISENYAKERFPLRFSKAFTPNAFDSSIHSLFQSIQSDYKRQVLNLRSSNIKADSLVHLLDDTVMPKFMNWVSNDLVKRITKDQMNVQKLVKRSGNLHITVPVNRGWHSLPSSPRRLHPHSNVGAHSVPTSPRKPHAIDTLKVVHEQVSTPVSIVHSLTDEDPEILQPNIQENSKHSESESIDHESIVPKVPVNQEDKFNTDNIDLVSDDIKDEKNKYLHNDVEEDLDKFYDAPNELDELEELDLIDDSKANEVRSFWRNPKDGRTKSKKDAPKVKANEETLQTPQAKINDDTQEIREIEEIQVADKRNFISSIGDFFYPFINSAVSKAIEICTKTTKNCGDALNAASNSISSGAISAIDFAGTMPGHTTDFAGQIAGSITQSVITKVDIYVQQLKLMVENEVKKVVFSAKGIAVIVFSAVFLLIILISNILNIIYLSKQLNKD